MLEFEQPKVIDIPRQQFCTDLLKGLDTSKKINIAVVGIWSSLVKTFLVDGFRSVRPYFENITFTGVDLKPGPFNPPEYLDFPWHKINYLNADEINTLSGNKKPKVDGVILAVPPNIHLDLAREWLERGATIWVEKPFVLPNQLEEAAKLIKKYPRQVFPVDFFLDSSPIRFLLENRKILQSIGKLERFDGRLVENWELEEGREWLLNPDISGGGLGMDILPHPLALADRLLFALGKRKQIEIQEVVRGRYEDENGAGPAGNEETYMYIAGKAGGVKVYIDGGKGTNEYYYGVTLTGDKGSIEVFTGRPKKDPYIFVQNKAGKTLYRFPEQGVGYGGVFFDFSLLLLGSDKSCFTPLEERQRIALNSIAYMRQAYAIAGECVPYPLKKFLPPVPVRPLGKVLQI